MRKTTPYTRGMLVMAASSVLFSAMSLLVPFARPASPFVMASSRYVTGIVAVLGMALLGLTRLRIRNWPWLVVRGLFGAFATYLYYYGIVRLGLGMGTILNNTYPVFAALLAPLLLKEKLSWDVAAAVLVSFAGIYMVVDPLGGARAGAGVSMDTILALAGGITAGIAIVAVRKLRETESSPVIYLSQCVFGILITGYPAARSSFAFPLAPWMALLGIGVLATVAQLLMTSAYRDVPTTEGSLLGFLTPVLNAVLAVLIFGEKFPPLAVAGSVVVLTACAWVALRERIVGAVR
jgi:drug/metabolite transporter (DMT)-like permease